MDFLKDFDDEFFWGLALIFTLVSFYDWLIGESGRSRHRDKIRVWWERLREIGYDELVADQADTVGTFYQAIQSRALEINRKLRFAKIYFTAMIVYSAYLLLIIAIYFANANALDKVDPAFFGYPSNVMIIYSLIFYSVSSVIASLFVTIQFLRRISKNPSAFVIVMCIAGDLGFLVLLTLFSNLMVKSAASMSGWLGFDLDIYVDDPAHFWDFDAVQNNDFLAVSFFLFFAFSAIPSIGHLSFSTLALACKVGDGAPKRLVERILQRIQESKKGVLTIVVLGLSTVAKLCQQGIKILVA